MSGARSATKWRDQAIIGLLEKLGRHRELEPEELTLMERTVRRLKPRREVWRWHPSEDEQIKALIRRRKRLGRPKPFQRNDEIRLLAQRLGRTEWAVRRRVERLRKCSRAAKKAKR